MRHADGAAKITRRRFSKQMRHQTRCSAGERCANDDISIYRPLVFLRPITRDEAMTPLDIKNLVRPPIRCNVYRWRADGSVIRKTLLPSCWLYCCGMTRWIAGRNALCSYKPKSSL
ncbi:hypothetical protein KCP74_15105 [Salmonella enterica subsp. enterica]|nr:hypothetical protein KCP74_15105 [Salmonella enterica subsp. enterica]